MADINTGGDVKDSAAIQRAKEALAKNAVSLAVALNESTADAADDNDNKNTIQSAAAVRGKEIKTEPEVAVTCVKKGKKRHQMKKPKLEQQVEKNSERPEKRVKIDEEDDEEEEDKDDISHDEDDKDENDEEEKEENEEKEEEDDEDDDEDEEDNKDNIPRFREVYARTMDDDELSDEDERIFLRFSGNNLKWGSRRERTIRVMEYAALSTYFERYANSIGVSVYSLRFFCDGCRLDGDRAAADYGLNEGDIVEVFEMQTGGHCH